MKVLQRFVKYSGKWAPPQGPQFGFLALLGPPLHYSPTTNLVA